VVLPVLQLLLLSNAATFAIRDTPAYLVDLDRTSVSRGLVTRLAASGRFRFVDQSPSLDLANDALLRGDVTMVLTIPHDFERQLVRSGTAPIELSLNAEKGSAAGIVQSYAAQIVAAYAAEMGAELHPTIVNTRPIDREPPPMRGAPRITVDVRSWYNTTLNYKHYMVPGLLVALVTMIGTLMTAQNIAREKELGTIEQLNVTPITRGQFIAAKLLPFLGLALIDLGIGLVVGHLVFGMPMRGSLVLLFGAAVVYLIAALSIGLFISTLVDTQQQAMFVGFFILNIYLLMSGLFTPIDSMAPWVQTVSLLNPVRYFVAISRAVLMKGAGFAEVARPLGILTVYGVVMLALAVRQYSKRMS